VRLPVVILAAGCALIWSARGQRVVAVAEPLSTALSEVPGLSIVEQPIPANEVRLAGMTDYFARAYHRDSTLVFTAFVAYYDEQRRGKTIHSPRNCLPGAGWEIVSGGTHRLGVRGGSHDINRYVLRNGRSLAVAYYWYQGRGRVTASEYQVKWNLLRDAALHGRTEEALVRLVVPIRADALDPEQLAKSVQAADASIAGIAGSLVGDLDRILPPMS
jgi:EpsI family protein